ncbi:MAG: hypothetical protein AAB553_06735 [Patescibacteria group bacterium]
MAIGIEGGRILRRKDGRPLYSPVFSEDQKVGLIDCATEKLQREFGQYAPVGVLKEFVQNGVHLIDTVEQATVPVSQVYSDTDIVYIDSGPGAYLPGTHKGDYQYEPYDWSRGMDRARIRMGLMVAMKVTSLRPEKNPPLIMYTATPKENALFTELITDLRDKEIHNFPPENFIVYGNYRGKDGQENVIKHTGHQIEGLDLHEIKVGKNRDRSPNRVVVITQSAHWLRIAHLMENFSENFPDETKVQVFPVATPSRLASIGNRVSSENIMSSDLNTAACQYALMELGGTAASIWKYDPPMASPNMCRFYINNELYVPAVNNGN